LLDDRPDLIGMMQGLRGLGVKIAVDDFGTGYSALSYLQRFPIDVLKIDRAFIRDLQRNDGDEAISTAIISMAHSMALKVVAEGVETPEQLNVLRSLGCDAAQGYYFAHPAPPAEIEHRTATSG
jgi:EAL domain-containing protein (putative c-di-GMP-specific phosphodiesterase class I)